MKNIVVRKFLAFLLAACSIVAVLACGGTAMMLESYGLYTDSLEDKQEQWYYNTGYPLAWQAAQRQSALDIGECSDALVEQLYAFSWVRDLSHYYITVWQGDEIVYTISEPIDNGITCEYSLTPEYPKVVKIYTPGVTEPTEEEEEEQENEETQPEETPPFWEATPVREDKVDIWEDGQRLIYELYYYAGPTYRVVVTMAPEALRDTFHSNIATYYPHRYTLIWAAAMALLCTAVTMVYLVYVAGKTKDGKLCPGGLNKLPLDVYLILGCAVGFFPGKVALDILYRSSNISFMAASIMLACGTFVCLLVLAVIFALAAQVKLGGGYWWRHSVLGVCAIKLWGWMKAFGRSIAAVFRVLPVIWQWLLPAGMMVVITTVAFWLGRKNSSLVMFALLFTCCILALILVFYGGYSFGIILLGARKMSQGDLRHKIPTRYLIAGFRDCAEQLNALSETARISTQKQLRAERMKTELITNVSHDIKTPLTTIINFVDLLDKAQTEEQRKQYLEILSRQSQQLKKLIEDLIELSKASTGNMQTHIIRMNAAETVNQTLGEFSDKLAAAKLTPIFHAPQEPVMIAADGRLTWRVLSNLMNNVVKYAIPDTRVYVDVEQKEQQVLLSIKNISREELHVPAEDLLERFVQGDSSRNKEGSGLGLNIAKSLMEVQNGKLELLLDGDLFKVTLIFPAG